MLPPLVQVGSGPFNVLPPGVHWATLADVRERFATSARRVWLFEGLTMAAAGLRYAGCRTLYLGGSYVTSKADPADFDGCWDPTGVSPERIDPVLLDFRDECATQKAKHGGELYVCNPLHGEMDATLAFFQMDTFSGERKGLVALRLVGS